ncbi:MAG: 50S ribosomal protein L13 [Pelolinea sp.]|nr:50S ribosomal protein L13 [Pelolinea sp.]
MIVEKTFVNKGKPEPQWLLIDANGQNLGRMATKIAHLLLGKHKPNFTPGVMVGDAVIVINASGVKVNPTREIEKIYYRHSNYPSGLKAVSYQHMLAAHPERIIESAVKGMLPHNRYGRKLMKRLKIYAGSEHPHAGQNPVKVNLE